MRNDSAEEDTVTLAGELRKLGPKLPGSVRHRFANSLDQFDRAQRLLDIDREMASFRAITGEEEAATCIMKAMQLRKYPHWSRFNPREHQHKTAIIACIMAMHKSVAPILTEFQLIFDYEKVRIDLKVPLRNFGVVSEEEYAIQPTEPLAIFHSKDGVSESKLFDAALSDLAGAENFLSIKTMVASQANSRNTLLYASDSGVPRSQLTREGLAQRKRRATAMLVLTIMIYQSRTHLPLVRQATYAFLSIIERLPAEV